MQANFEKHTFKAKDFFQKIANHLDQPDNLIKAERVAKAVLHGLRNRLGIEDSFQLISQLPLYIKGIYVDGWKISKEYVRIKHLEEFINEVYKEAGKTAELDFGTNTNALKSIKSVLLAIKEQVSEGEIEHLRAVLPKELKQLLEETVII